VLAVNVHQLQLKVGYPILLCRNRNQYQEKKSK
jgi:hypothetical protein